MRRRFAKLEWSRHEAEVLDFVECPSLPGQDDHIASADEGAGTEETMDLEED